MKWILIFSLVVQGHSAESGKTDTQELKRQIATIMGQMHLPQMGVSKLTAEGNFNSKYFKQASSDFITQATKMVAIKHPEAAFQSFNNQMLEALKTFDAAVKAVDPEKIKKSWLSLNKTCYSCHSVYHAKKEGN